MKDRDQSVPTNEIKLPLFSGELSCGLFGITEDYVEDYLSLDEKFMKNKSSTFFVRASGSSMMPMIMPNDILIVDRSLEPSSESIVAVFYNGTPICKQFIISNETKILRSLNSEYEDILITPDDDLVIFGVVIGLARDLV